MQCPFCNLEMRLGEIAGIRNSHISWIPDPEEGHELDGKKREKPVRLSKQIFTKPKITTFHCTQCDKLIVDPSDSQTMTCPYCKVDMRRGIIITDRMGVLYWQLGPWSLRGTITLNTLLLGTVSVPGARRPMLPFRVAHCAQCEKFIA